MTTLDARTNYSNCRRAAENGDAASQSKLAVMYSKGSGVTRNYKTAFKWCRLAALQGHAPGQCTLGMMYYQGAGLPKDYTRAYMWLHIAVSNGNSSAVRLQEIVARMMSSNQIERAQDLAKECLEKNYRGF